MSKYFPPLASDDCSGSSPESAMAWIKYPARDRKLTPDPPGPPGSINQRSRVLSSRLTWVDQYSAAVAGISNGDFCGQFGDCNGSTASSSCRSSPIQWNIETCTLKSVVTGNKIHGCTGYDLAVHQWNVIHIGLNNTLCSIQTPLQEVQQPHM